MKKIELSMDFSPRLYQQSIFASSMNKNSLVVLPTGLGKTVIALMLSVYYFNKDNKKILFLAPTKPLVEQQKKSFEKFFENNDIVFDVLTGIVSPKDRLNRYNSSDFIFSTPQLIENDLINGRINPNNFSFIIFDECHRAVGNYAYTFIAKEFIKTNSKFLGLSASPGTSLNQVDEIIQNLFIENLEVRKYDDFDVREYVKETKLEKIQIILDDNFKEIIKLLNEVYNKKLKMLQELGFLKNKSINLITKRDLLELQILLRKEVSKGGISQEINFNAISTCASLMKIQYGIELFESQEISVAYNYFYNFFREGGDSSKAARDLNLDIDFREAFSKIKELNEKKVIHPKLLKLKELVSNFINKNKDLKIIIFSQYRESGNKIVNELNDISKNISAVSFVGQSKKSNGVGLSQKEQKRIIQDFREDKYNILVSTSVGEEGLDVPKVDMVIFYEPVASAIRSIQRLGRTGRFDKGYAYILQSEGTRDILTSHIASAKEKKMYKVLDEVRKKFIERPVRNLNSFISEKKEVTDNLIPKIIIDSRENSDLIKELYKQEVEIETKRLDIGDIVISDHIAIERKSKSDFVNSILDKRLFPQLIDLSRNYRRPVLIIEGEENMFALRNLNPNVIRSTLSTIAIDLRIPIIYTDSIIETSLMVVNIARRTLRTKKDVSLATDKRSFSENEELEKFVSTIPKINVVSAKSILNHFGSIKELVNASESDLLKVEGLGRIRAKHIKEFFEREYQI